VIESGAFACCSSLSSITIPRDVEVIGSECFRDCLALSLVVFKLDSRLKEIKSKAFSMCYSLISIIIPRNVEVIGSGCFSGCDSLSSISFKPDAQLKRIESKAFPGTALESITFSRSL
jgi:hypothetical protein